ncbi:hypothetical protein BCR44DRAFT_1036349 [Catenaria anguillulae PL171]|uniref:Uncharacterized protein n=1 Tax=Catenaria anguillulae PL171 TaxID=765915 RepID=A0A1Y2HSP1_9FUNG|nr:hypothetical protein BCR44DRAFT_1036349 [Catenaria anguillulae PL171]
MGSNSLSRTAVISAPPSRCSQPHIDPVSLHRKMDLPHIVASLSRYRREWMVEQLLLSQILPDAAGKVRLFLNNACLDSSSCLAVLGLACLRMANDIRHSAYVSDFKFSRFMDILRIPRPLPSLSLPLTPNQGPPVPPATPLNPMPPGSSPPAAASSQNHPQSSGHPTHASAAPAANAAPAPTPDAPALSPQLSEQGASAKKQKSKKKPKRKPALKRNDTADAVIEVTQDAIMSLATRRKRHAQHVDRLLALHWQAHLVSTGMTQFEASPSSPRPTWGARLPTRLARRAKPTDRGKSSIRLASLSLLSAAVRASHAQARTLFTVANSLNGPRRRWWSSRRPSRIPGRFGASCMRGSMPSSRPCCQALLVPK